MPAGDAATAQGYESMRRANIERNRQMLLGAMEARNEFHQAMNSAQASEPSRRRPQAWSRSTSSSRQQQFGPIRVSRRAQGVAPDEEVPDELVHNNNRRPQYCEGISEQSTLGDRSASQRLDLSRTPGASRTASWQSYGADLAPDELAMERGEKKALALLRQLEGEGKTGMAKVLSRSTVSGGFWLNLDKAWWGRSFPGTVTQRTVVMALEDSAGETHQVLCKPYRPGLSGQWKEFAMKKRLVWGDSIVFEKLPEAKHGCKAMKVHIFRCNAEPAPAAGDSTSFEVAGSNSAVVAQGPARNGRGAHTMSNIISKKLRRREGEVQEPELSGDSDGDIVDVSESAGTQKVVCVDLRNESSEIKESSENEEGEPYAPEIPDTPPLPIRYCLATPCAQAGRKRLAERPSRDDESSKRRPGVVSHARPIEVYGEGESGKGEREEVEMVISSQESIVLDV